MNDTLKILSAFTAVLLLAGACEKTLESTYDSQETKIATVVKTLQKADTSATVSYQNGTVRVTMVHGTGDSLSAGGAVSFYYAGYCLSSPAISTSNLFATNYKDFASSVKWNVSDSTILAIKTVDLAKDDIVPGLKRGLVGVKGGDECYVLFSGKYGFGKRKTGQVPANSALAYRLWIKSVSN